MEIKRKAMKEIMLKYAIIFALIIGMPSCHKDDTKNNNTNNNDEHPYMAAIIYNAVTDIDGNSYNAVQIGNQVWMAEDLRTRRYADGRVINRGSTQSMTDPYTKYWSVTLNDSIFDVHAYNWPAVMDGASSSNRIPSGVQGICPDGWHVPSRAEWESLRNYVRRQSQCVCNYNGYNDNSNNIGKALSATLGWKSSNVSCAVGNNSSSNNLTGFSALPFYIPGKKTRFWTATEESAYWDYWAHYYSLEYDRTALLWCYEARSDFYFVRCVRD